PPIPKQVDQYEVGIVNLRVFALDQRAAQKRLQQMERLRSYGWVDREAGVAHIPVEEAMKMYLAEQQKKGNHPECPACGTWRSPAPRSCRSWPGHGRTR